MSGQQKPFRGTQLNRTHPLVRGLQAVFLFNEGGGNIVNDLMHNYTLTGVQGTPEWVTDGMYFSGSDEALNFSNTSLNERCLSSCLFAVVTPDGDQSNVGAIMSHGDYAPYWAINAARHLLVYPPVSAVSTGAVTPNEKNILTWNYAGSYGGSFEYWINGALDTVTTWSNISWSNGPINIASGKTGTPYYDFKGTIHCIFYWTRQLSKEEIALLHREPYCMFTRPVDIGAFEYVASGAFNIIPRINYYNRLLRR